MPVDVATPTETTDVNLSLSCLSLSRTMCPGSLRSRSVIISLAGTFASFAQDYAFMRDEAPPSLSALTPALDGNLTSTKHIKQQVVVWCAMCEAVARGDVEHVVFEVVP